MNNEHDLQAISLDEMEAIQGGSQGSECARAVIATGAAVGAFGWSIGGPVLAGLGALVGGMYEIETNPICRPPTSVQ